MQTLQSVIWIDIEPFDVKNSENRPIITFINDRKDAEAREELLILI